jgi:hypothetical protein
LGHQYGTAVPGKKAGHAFGAAKGNFGANPSLDVVRIHKSLTPEAVTGRFVIALHLEAPAAIALTLALLTAFAGVQQRTCNSGWGQHHPANEPYR